MKGKEKNEKELIKSLLRNALHEFKLTVLETML